MSTIRIISGAFTPFFVMPVTDGTTSTFILKSSGIIDRIALKILTRWGSTIYESTNYDNSWDGANAAAGTYYYDVAICTPASIARSSSRGWIEVVK